MLRNMYLRLFVSQRDNRFGVVLIDCSRRRKQGYLLWLYNSGGSGRCTGRAKLDPDWSGSLTLVQTPNTQVIIHTLGTLYKCYNTNILSEYLIRDSVHPLYYI